MTEQTNGYRLYSEIGVGVTVATVNPQKWVGIKEPNILDIPPGELPEGFQLMLGVKKAAPILVAAKRIGVPGGAYARNFNTISGDDQDFFLTQDVIRVKQSKNGNRAWTDWTSPNRVDIWKVEDGVITLFQVGVVTHDDGKTFRLVGKEIWKGTLFRRGRGLVAKPLDPALGSFESRKVILEDRAFKRLIANGSGLPHWRGRREELDPSLRHSGLQDEAYVKWYTLFGGMAGQGMATLSDGREAWILGDRIEPDREELRSLQRGDMLRFRGIQNRRQKDGPPFIKEVLEVWRTPQSTSLRP